MKPIIGVTPDFNAGDRKEWGGREPTYFLGARYIRAIEELGGVPLVLPLHTDRATRRRLLQQIDGLLLTEADRTFHRRCMVSASAIPSEP